MHVICHQAVGPDTDAVFLRVLDYPGEIALAVGIIGENIHAEIAALSNVVRVSGNDSSGHSGHGGTIVL
jgi:hypothetical protein